MYVLFKKDLGELLTYVSATIITCFPQKWGKNNQDSSDVHRSICTRLKTSQQFEINSAFDLALIIVDQCSKVFFDRSKRFDRAPDLVDIFADAIRTVVSLEY